MSPLPAHTTISERRCSLRYRKADQVEAARKLARESRSSLNSTDPKWFEHTEDILRCDMEDIDRQESKLRKDLRSGRISSARWQDWQNEIIDNRSKTRDAINATITSAVELRRKTNDSEAKRRAEDAFIELLLNRFDKAEKRDTKV